MTATGELGDDSAPVLTATLDGLLSGASEAITIFWDLSGLRRWEPSGRREVTRTLLRHRPRIAEHHVLATSPVIRMDARVIGLVLGSVNSYHERALFELTIDAAVAAEHRECA